MQINKFFDNILILILYYSVAKFGPDLMAMSIGSLNLIWLPSGIGLLAMLLKGPHVIWGIMIAVFCLSFPNLYDPEAGHSFLKGLSFSLYGSLVDGLHIALPYYICKKVIQGDIFHSVKSITQFYFYAALGPIALTSALLVGGYIYGGYVQAEPDKLLITFAMKWFSVTLSDFHGIITFVPLILAITAKGQFLSKGGTYTQLLFKTLLLLSLIYLCLFFAPQIIYLTMPLLVWFAFTDEIHYGLSAIFVLSISLSLGTVQGLGPFVDAEPTVSLIMIVVMIMSFSYSFLVIKILRDNSVLHLTELESKIEERTKKLNIALIDAEESNLAKSQFLATMSHEMRTPLNGIIGLLDWIKKQKIPLNIQGRLNTVVGASDHLETLVNNILQLSSSESKMLTPHKGNINLGEFLESIQAMFVKEMNNPNVHFTIKLDKSLAENWLGHPDQLRQILFNLIGNALKFTEKGEVCLHVGRNKKSPDTLLDFSVKDTGIGIAEKDQKRIFETFVQGDQSNSRIYEGVGLGLSLCKKFISQLGGKIDLKSNQDTGTIVSFTLPMEPMYDAVHPTKKVDKPTSSNHHSDLKILIIEDSQINREVYEVFLEDTGFDVTTLPDGQNIIQTLSKNHFEIIIIDLHLPIISGVEVISMIREWEHDTGVDRQKSLIYVVTADVMEENHKQALMAGANKVVLKPIRQKDFLNLLNQADLNSHKSTRMKTLVNLESVRQKYLIGLEEKMDKLSNLLSTKDLLEFDELTHRILGAAQMVEANEVADKITLIKDITSSADPNLAKIDQIIHEVKDIAKAMITHDLRVK